MKLIVQITKKLQLQWSPEQIAGWLKRRYPDEHDHVSHETTLVERQTRYVMLAKVDNRTTDTVVRSLIKQSRTLPGELYKSLSWDRGSELAAHKDFTLPAR